MIGIVVVSHSHALATAVVALASEMVDASNAPVIEIAAGLDESTFGTDAVAIYEAIERADTPDGVLVFLDLGSAILSAEMAVEMLDPDLAERVTLTSAPLVEGLVAAVVTASTGASLAEVDAEARSGLAAKAEHLGGEEAAAQPEAPSHAESDDDADALEFRHVITNPHGLHARPAATLVSGLRGLDATITLRNATRGKPPAPASSLTKVATLDLRCGDEMVASISGPEKDAALARLSALAADSFGEHDADAPIEVPAASGVGTGQQVVIGVAWPVSDTVDTSSYVASDPRTEQERLDTAVERLSAHLAALALDNPAQAGIFEAQTALLADDEWQAQASRQLRDGASAVGAVHSALSGVAAQFEALSDPYLRERAGDVRSIERLLLTSLVGGELHSGAARSDAVWIVNELDAATASGLNPDNCAGVITVRGGNTGHGVIVAGAKGIPCLTGRVRAAQVAAGTHIAFDPLSGELWIEPGPSQVASLTERATERAAAEAAAAEAAHDPALTRAGRRVLVEANVASLDDAATGAASGADGSGLVRTEILFGHDTTAPSAERQADTFIAIGRALGGQTITIRTWDAGGDKPLPFLAQDAESNPFLGERGIRTMRRVPDLLADQLRACLLASREVSVRVMFPMVTEPDELRWARGMLDELVADLEVDPIPVGMMVEVPAAALRAAEFADLVDFVSIGTNDLTQYTTAADRGNGAVSHLARGDSPAVLDLIGRTAEALAGKPIAVCGDLASQAPLTATLLGLGVTELSVRPGLVGLIKAAVRDAE